MGERVIVGFDGSPHSAAALAWAAREATLRGAPLVAVVALDDRASLPYLDQPEHASPAEVEQEWTRQAEDVAGNVPVQVQVVHGHPASELTAAATEKDLLVVGSRSRSAFAGLLLGSVSRACLLHAPCPVVITREGVDGQAVPRHGRVIVGVDGSDYARAALRIAGEEARLRGATLDAIHAAAWERVGVEWVAPVAQDLVRLGHTMLTTEIGRTGVAARPVVIEGHPADVLVRCSADADLLVLGTRGHSRLGSLLVGSVTDHCARHAACPVMVTRHPDDGN